ncbi:MAG TPA: ABC transporter ATP-binding protein [Candidatus Baltobacteraceae bacterium]|nr:ABC transporter ATP-binding protein [Candidatus Baltobacteraceae bacterium]
MALLSVSGVTKRFGGLIANNRVSFEVAEGEILGLIGPNGAGKSTLFEVINGYYPPDGGEIRFQGQSLVGLRPDQVNRVGIGRTFQKVRPFLGMTVIENVMVAAMQHTPDPVTARREAIKFLEFVELAGKRDTNARSLSVGERKRLEMARAMATRPKLLLLDEVTGGVDQRTIPTLLALIGRVRSEQGLTLVVIEHNMRVIMSISDRIVALHLGEVIADGPPAAVVKERRVIDAYLGDAFVVPTGSGG